MIATTIKHPFVKTNTSRAIRFLDWAAFSIICGLTVLAPLARGAVHGWAIGLIHLSTLSALAAILIRKSLTRDWQWIQTPMDKPILLIMIIAAVSTVFSIHPKTSFRSMAVLINFIALFYVAVHVIHTRFRLRFLCGLIIGTALFLSVFGTLKRFGMNPFPFWDYLDLNYPECFMASTFGNHNHLAGFLEMSLLLLTGFLFTGISREWRMILAYIFLLTLGAFILTLSRGGWISFSIGFAFVIGVLLIQNKPGNKAIFFSAGIFLSALVLFVLSSTPVTERIMTLNPGNEASGLDSRISIWKGVMQMIKDYPVTGTGPGTFSLVFTQYHPPGFGVRYYMAHNDYLHFVSETGLPALPVMIWMVFCLFHSGFKKLKHPSRLVRYSTLGAMGGITSILVHSAVDFNLHIPANVWLFTLLVAIAVGACPVRSKKHTTQ